MKKYLIAVFLGFVLTAPVAASAATADQVIPLYRELIVLLTKQLELLQAPPVAALPTLSIESPEGTAPYAVLFELSTTTGRDAVDFGDGHSTWTDGCSVRLANGWCPVRTEIAHTYAYPGTYVVRLFSQDPKAPLATSTVIVR